MAAVRKSPRFALAAAALVLIVGGSLAMPNARFSHLSSASARLVADRSAAPPARGGQPPRVIRASLIPPTSRAYSLAPGTVLPFSELRAVSFATTSEGFAVAGPLGSDYVAQTTDGGNTWRVDSPVVYVAAADAAGYVGSIVTGAKGEAIAYGGGVDMTTDAGSTWWRAYIGQETLAVSAEGGTAWVLARSENDDHLWLYESSDGGRKWTYTATLPELSGAAAQLVRPSPRIAYVLVGDNEFVTPASGIMETTDSGTVWTRRADPCEVAAAPRTFYSEQLLASSPADLWLVCGGAPGAGGSPPGGQVKRVERSEDGGRNWRLIAAASGVEPDFGNLPIRYTVPPTGEPGQVLLEPEAEAWMILGGPQSVRPQKPLHEDRFLGRNVLDRTVDGGTMWDAGATVDIERQYPQEITAVGGTIFVQTVKAIWETKNGKTWTSVSAKN